MKMEFNYEDFRTNYLYCAELMPSAPLNPMTIIDPEKFGNAIDERGIDTRIRNTFTALENRMGGEYFSKFERVQTRSKEYGALAFPAYKFLFLDIVCEDWLSLVDFHKGFSRDHSIHQPLTAYIVCKLLGKGKQEDAFKISGISLLDKALDAIITNPATQYLRDRLSSFDPDSPLLQGDRQLWRLVFYQTAIITAMYHDLGYPWQFIERMHEFLKDEIVLCGRLPENSAAIAQYVDAHKGELMFSPFYDYGRGGKTPSDIKISVFEEYLHESHGLPGALAFDAYNKAFRSEVKTASSELIKFCQEWSCLAIMMHDMQKAYAKNGFPKLDFVTDPLSYIIALADTLEDFNRPNAIIKKGDKGCNIEYSFPSLEVVLEENASVGEIRYKMSPETLADQVERKVKDQKDLFDQPTGYFDLASVGLSQMSIRCY